MSLRRRRPLRPRLPSRCPPAAPAANPVADQVLAIVAAKTGYPPDMLDLDLDLEADLGVDTVKQAEVFAAVREAFGIARIENLKLRDFPTLRHVMTLVFTYRPDLEVGSAAPSGAGATAPATPAPMSEPAATAAPSTGPPAGNEVDARVLAIVADKTGYPPDMLDLDLDLEADLGVDTVKQAEMFAAVREAFSIARVENLRLRDFPTLRHVVRFVYDHRPDLVQQGSAAPPPAPVRPLSEGPADQPAASPPAAAPTSVAPSPAAASAEIDPTVAIVLGIVAEKRATRPTCSSSIWTSRRISASTR